MRFFVQGVLFRTPPFEKGDEEDIIFEVKNGRLTLSGMYQYIHTCKFTISLCDYQMLLFSQCFQDLRSLICTDPS